MTRLDAMLERLPPLWRIESGSQLHELLALLSIVLAEFDQDMDRVQRSHFVDHAFARADVEKLGALFDVPAAPWEDLVLYRTRLKATIAALLRGPVIRTELIAAVARILEPGLASLGIERASFASRGAAAGDVRLEEFPIRRRRVVPLEQLGRLTPLDRWTCDHGGVEASPVLGTIRGVKGHRTSVPTLVNLTTGDVLSYAGLVRCGEELTLSLAGDRLTARHGGEDVTSRLLTGRGFVPGSPWGKAVADAVPRPLRLRPGHNQLWFVCLGLYDAPGFDGAGFQAPTVEVQQAVFAGTGASGPQAGTSFDASLFRQDPAAVVDLYFDERPPARFRLELPTAVLLRSQSAPESEAVFDRLVELLGQSVARLRGAAIDGRVGRARVQEVVPLSDAVTVSAGEYGEETKASADLSGLSALFDITAEDGARFE